MKKVFLVSVFCCLAICLLTPANAMDTRISPWRGYYYGKTDQPGRSQKVIEVDVFPAMEGQAMYIDFMVSGNPPGHIVGGVGEVTSIKKKQFNFAIMDTPRSKGRGHFSRRGENYVLHLELARRSPSGKLKGYSSADYVVVKQDSNAKKDRHPWSLGRIRPSPEISSKPGSIKR